MVQLAQCVYLLKQVILKKKRDADFWITAQELLLSSIFEHSCRWFCQNCFLVFNFRRTLRSGGGGVRPRVIGVLATVPTL